MRKCNVFQIDIEPLSNRIEDIPLLIEYFSEKISKNYNIKKFTIEDNNYLLNYNWPGNVRELRNLIERIAILSPGNNKGKVIEIIKESLKDSRSDEFSLNDSLSIPLKEARESFEKEYLLNQVKKSILECLDFGPINASSIHFYGRKGKNISVGEADNYIMGYTIMNDLSARALQKEEMK